LGGNKAAIARAVNPWEANGVDRWEMRGLLSKKEDEISAISKRCLYSLAELQNDTTAPRAKIHTCAIGVFRSANLDERH